jgi:hypothetical protein
MKRCEFPAGKFHSQTKPPEIRNVSHCCYASSLKKTFGSGNFMVHPDALGQAADVHLNLIAHHYRMQDILNAHAYALDSRAVDFPPLFCFGDLVELELDCTSVENGGVACKRVPAIVVDILQDNWLRLLVFRR